MFGYIINQMIYAHDRDAEKQLLILACIACLSIIGVIIIGVRIGYALGGWKGALIPLIPVLLGLMYILHLYILDYRRRQKTESDRLKTINEEHIQAIRQKTESDRLKSIKEEHIQAGRLAYINAASLDQEHVIKVRNEYELKLKEIATQIETLKKADKPFDKEYDSLTLIMLEYNGFKDAEAGNPNPQQQVKK